MYDTKTKMRRDYIWTTSCLVLCSFFYGLMTIASHETLTGVYWAFGFVTGCLFYPSLLIFICNILEFKQRLIKLAVSVTFPLTAILALVCVFSSNVTIIHTAFGNQFSYQRGLLFTVFFLYIFFLAGSNMAAFLLWRRRSALRGHRRQIYLMLLLTAIASPVVFSTEFIIPVFADFTIVPLAAVALFPASVQVYVLMKKYKTFGITTSNISGHTFTSVTMPIFALDYKNIINLENNAAVNFMGKSVIGSNIADFILVSDKSPKNDFFNQSFESKTVTVKTLSDVRICDMVLTPEYDKFNDAICKIVVLRDVTESKHKDNLLQAVNQAAVLLLTTEENEDINIPLLACMEIVGRSMSADHVSIWRNEMHNNELYSECMSNWYSETGKKKRIIGKDFKFAFKDKFLWESNFINNECISGPVSKMSQKEQAFLGDEIKSIVMIPLFLDEQFWGLFIIEDFTQECNYAAEEVAILRSVSLMMVSAINRHALVEKRTHELDIARKIAQAASKSKSDFLASMSHEIRTPMNAIMGITEILMQSKHSDETKEALIKILNSCDLLLGIINDILDFSKIEAGKLDIIPAQYEVASMINDSAYLNMMKIDEKPIEFEVHVCEKTPAKLIGDELRIKQILNNLLSNAFKYTDAGKVTLTVEYEPEKQGLLLSVRDTGLGMTEEQLKKLFSEYSRFHQKTNDEEGTGLGLTITQRLVKLMDGEILVESKSGVGSLFTVKLPQKLVDADVLGADVAEKLRLFRLEYITGRERRQVIRDPMPYGKVLIVDDIEPNLFVAAGLMKPYGLQIETVMNGKDAIEKIKDGNIYDIIFMDHMMPEMDGIQATKRIRKLGYKEPVIALTANALTGQAEIFLQKGFDDFISKPIDIRQLNAVLNKYVRDKQPPEVIKAFKNTPINDEVSEIPETISMLKKIDGLNVDAALTAMGGQHEMYEKTVRLTVRLLPGTIEKMDKYLAEDNLKDFTTEVHGMRGVFNNIGASLIGNTATNLENAALSGQKNFCLENYPPFKELLLKFSEQFNAVINSGLTVQKEKIEKDAFSNALKTAKTAAESYDSMQALEALKSILDYSYYMDISKLLEKTVHALEEFKCQEAVESINDIERTIL